MTTPLPTITDPVEGLEGGASADAGQRAPFGTYLEACRDLFDSSHSVAFQRDLYGDLLGEAERIKAAALVMADELRWLEMFADVRSKDDSKVFARVNRGALRNIATRARAALNKALGK